MTGGSIGSGSALVNLGEALQPTDRTEEAVSTLTRAARLFRVCGADGYEARASHALGEVLLALGRAEEAVSAFSRTASLCHGLGDHGREGSTLLGLAAALEAADRPDEAAISCAQAATAFEQAGDAPAKGWALTDLALYCYWRAGPRRRCRRRMRRWSTTGVWSRTNPSCTRMSWRNP
ncbi:tetratricopeptide repeat protein [Streptomyces sp. NPDC001796]|uniref:tetratricopeptide repeat protein n=1 Tax=Streptomyces sp. NPDC001796 TaxID=3364609 RepID=UPI00368CFD4F